jgi:ribonuclease BN (tRNA processing enzyme)
MKLKILGSGTCIPSLKRGSSAYLVSLDNPTTILVDAGPSTVHRLLEFGYSVNDIDLIIITHFHVDHTADLATFLFVCNYGLVPREKPLLIVGGQGICKFYRGLRAIYPWVAPKKYSLAIKSMPSGTLEREGLLIETKRANHMRESIAVRITSGKSITFTGDSDYSRNIVRLARHTDLLVAECAFPEKKVRGHMNLITLERTAGEAEAKRVLLSHLYPDWDDFRGVLHSPYLMGEDGLEMEV